MNLLILIIITLCFSAFFSGMEIAFLTSNKLKIELDNKQGGFSAKLLSGFVKQPGRFIGAMLVGNNIALVFYGIFMARLLEPIFHTWNFSEPAVLLSQTIVSTLVILLVGEFLPKTLFRANSNFILNLLAVPTKIIYYVLWIPMYLMVGLSELIIRFAFGLETGKKEIAFGRVDLSNYVREITQTAERTEEELENEIQIFQNALDFSKLKARDCMVPRTEIVAVSIDEDVKKLRELFIESGYSKAMVYRDSIDNIIGYVNSSELFNNPDSVKRMIVPVVIIPETISAKEVLELFIKQNKSIAVVVDEFGGTSGILTIEDIIEEIFGDIEDEHDQEVFLEEKINDTTYHFAARLEIDYLNDKYKLDFPESDEYETLAGYIIHNHEDIPELNSVIEIDNYSFKITAVSNVRIETVLVQLLDEE